MIVTYPRCLVVPPGMLSSSWVASFDKRDQLHTWLQSQCLALNCIQRCRPASRRRRQIRPRTLHQSWVQRMDDPTCLPYSSMSSWSTFLLNNAPDCPWARECAWRRREPTNALENEGRHVVARGDRRATKRRSTWRVTSDDARNEDLLYMYRGT